LGKTEIVKKLFKVGFPAHNYSFLNCRIYFKLEDIFEVSLKRLSSKKITCKNIDDFATNLQIICETNEETRYLVRVTVKNIHLLFLLIFFFFNYRYLTTCNYFGFFLKP